MLTRKPLTEPCLTLAAGSAFFVLSVINFVLPAPTGRRVLAVVSMLFWGFHAICSMMDLHNARRANRTIERGERGCCLPCGYDLRATPARCPECGEPGATRRADEGVEETAAASLRTGPPASTGSRTASSC